jgi:hypothetical protein
MTSIKHVGTNAIEDGVEDFFSTVIYNRMREITKPFLKDYEGEGAFNEAMQSFINTLAMGMAIYSLTKIMTFFFERSSKMMTFLFGYMIFGKLKKRAVEKLKNSKWKGKRLFRGLSVIMGADRTSERIEIAKMAQNQVNSYDQHKFHYENQHMGSQNLLDNAINPMSNFKSNMDNKAVTLFTDLTFRGAWKNTNEHKKIYEKATGFKLATTGQGSWNSLYKELNKHTQFHKTANDEVTNLTTVLAKTLATKGAI